MYIPAFFRTEIETRSHKRDWTKLISRKDNNSKVPISKEKMFTMEAELADAERNLIDTISNAVNGTKNQTQKQFIEK